MYGTNKAKVDYNLLNDEEPHARQARPGHGHQPHACRRGQDHHDGRPGGRPAPHRARTWWWRCASRRLGPVFGIKGGAAGGGYAQVVPMEDINLHFTGDFHAIGAANNLLAAMLDNHIHQGNELGIDPAARSPGSACVDMNDRQLRNVVDGLGGKANGVPREDGFDITVASEVMAVLCLANDITDLKERLAPHRGGLHLRRASPVTAARPARRRAPWPPCSRTR